MAALGLGHFHFLIFHNKGKQLKIKPYQLLTLIKRLFEILL